MLCFRSPALERTALYNPRSPLQNYQCCFERPLVVQHRISPGTVFTSITLHTKQKRLVISLTVTFFYRNIIISGTIFTLSSSLVQLKNFDIFNFFSPFTKDDMLWIMFWMKYSFQCCFQQSFKTMVLKICSNNNQFFYKL